MDYDALRARLEGIIPFNTHLGLRVLCVEDGVAKVGLPAAPELLNHVGTQHAAAVFACGEAASGGVLAGSFAEIIESYTPLARSADIKYSAPARGPIVATARLATEKRWVLEQLDARGRAQFLVNVDVRNEENVRVAKMSVSWYLVGPSTGSQTDGAKADKPLPRKATT